MSRNAPCSCGSGLKGKRCCESVAVYDARGLLHAGPTPHGFVCVAADEADVTAAELLALLRGEHPEHLGSRLWFIAGRDDGESFRFATPGLVKQYAAKEYPGMAFLCVALPDEWWTLQVPLTLELYESLP